MIKDKSIYEIEFELKDLFNSVKRNLKLFIICSSTISFLSFSYAQLKKKVWQGEFQIVLGDQGETNIRDNLFSIAPGLTQLTGINTRRNMQTEVGILKSPSTLIPIFEFYKSEKRKIDKTIDKITFKAWSEGSLDIKLTDKTSILNVKYKDTQKDIIVPILERISDKYKNFSSQAKIKDLKLSSNYLLGQINKYDKKSKVSRRALQEFAIDNGLQFDPKSNLSNTPKLNLNKTDSLNFNTRISQENKIKIIDMQLDKIKNSDLNLMPYFLTQYDEFSENKTLKDLNILESEIALKSGLFRKNDQEIINLNNRKKFLLNNLKYQIVNFLKSEKIKSSIYLNASIKPKNILIKYRELNREAIKNEDILNKLQNLYTMNNLKLAESKKPWLLITEPNLSKKYFSPNKKRIFILGSVIGLIFGATLCYLKETQSKIVYEPKFLKKIFNKSNLINLQDYDESKWTKLLDLFISNNTFDLNKDNITFLELGDFREEKLTYFRDSLLKTNLNKKFDTKNDVLNLPDKLNIMLVTAMGDVKYDDLLEVRNILNLKKIELLGVILL